MKKILLVEDDDVIVRIYRQALAFAGFDVVAAESGKAGLKKVLKEKPDLILLDVMMPEMNGFEVLQALKRDPALKSIPVVLLTNLSGRDYAQKALEMGAVNYIVKSQHKPEEIALIVEEILQLNP